MRERKFLRAVCLKIFGRKFCSMLYKASAIALLKSSRGSGSSSSKLRGLLLEWSLGEDDYSYTSSYDSDDEDEEEGGGVGSLFFLAAGCFLLLYGSARFLLSSLRPPPAALYVVAPPLAVPDAAAGC